MAGKGGIAAPGGLLTPIFEIICKINLIFAD